MASTKRNRVADGGMFSSRRVTFSKETQDLLKTMMKESRLTNLQQRKIRDSMLRGEELPLTCSPSASHKSHKKGLNADTKHKQSGAGGLRTFQTIQQLEDASDQSQLNLPRVPRYNSSVEKEKLHNIMAFGCAKPKEIEQRVSRTESQDEEQEIERFEEILKEIEEREQFLEDMRKLGQEDKYHSQITTEISQRIRELELIDKNECLT